MNTYVPAPAIPDHRSRTYTLPLSELEGFIADYTVAMAAHP